MHMFCFQCQETSPPGCMEGGTCGKSEETANYQDLLIYVLKGIGLLVNRADKGTDPGQWISDQRLGDFIFRSLYMTVTNTNFDTARIESQIVEALQWKRRIFGALREAKDLEEPEAWDGKTSNEIRDQAYSVGVLDTKSEDVRSLRETVIYGLKGICAYGHHAADLGIYDSAITAFVLRSLSAVYSEESVAILQELVLETGRMTLTAMEALDRSHRKVFGEPRAVNVPIGVGRKPAILVSGHDLKILKTLLEQSEREGVDVYTHGEMISAHYYPELRRFANLAGNYGNSWWRQDVEFESFNGPILVTTNCIIPVHDSYKQRIFTSGVAGYPGVAHWVKTKASGEPDFSDLIALARALPSPHPIDQGTMPGGYTHGQLVALIDKILAAVAAGKIRRFFVVAGCDGRDLRREYYKELAQKLPSDAVILTAGCTKYMFCKLPLGTIDGIPRVLDAGQCNDCYSLIAFAAHLQKTVGAADINDLPVSYDVAWYDQKAVAVLLALLFLGVKNVRLGPTMPAFFSKNVLEIMSSKFRVREIKTAEGDISEMLRGN